MKNWNIKSTINTNNLSNTEILDILLENRGISSSEEKERFLDTPKLQQYLNDFPNEFKDGLKEARKLIVNQINNKAPILIYGDYDADGVCATAILFNCLTKELGHKNTYYFIPNRFKHGYGISFSSVDEILETLPETNDLLFITVDTGITAVDEIEYIKNKGFKVILTDHHQKPSVAPDPDVLVWSDKIVGSSISWILSRVLGSQDATSLALAGIATVTDVQELIGINRVFVKSALSLLNTTPPEGIRLLSSLAKKKDSEITAYDLGWVIGPRLNASGRIVDAAEALEILIQDDIHVLKEAVLKLDSLNRDRQDKTLEMYELASEFNENEIPKIIVSASPDYHEGIIGLVASRLVQKHYRPSIVISVDGDTAKGSVRSVPGIDIIAVLREFEDMFLNLGGHPMAAGFSIKTENISELSRNLSSYFSQNIDDALLIPQLDIDIEMPIQNINFGLMESLKSLEPFGVGNPEPKFLSRGLKIININYMGSENQHLALKVYDGNDFYKALLFNGADNAVIQNLAVGDPIDLVYKPKINEFRGNVSIDLFIEDLKVSE